jgi:hypothetical protein
MKKIMRQPDQYMHLNNKCSFILRLWREEQSEALGWRASVEIPETGKRIGFASLEQLFAFLIDFTEINCDLKPIENKKKEINNT